MTVLQILQLALLGSTLLLGGQAAPHPRSREHIHMQVTAQRELNAHASETALAGDLDPYPTKPRITFRADGTFKITVFSDLHYGENPWDAWGPQQDANSTELMRIVLADEKPDYVCVCSSSAYVLAP